MSKLRLLLVLLVAVAMASCSTDSDSTSSSNDYCYISSVVLGTVKRKTNTVNTSVLGSNYIMTINHRTGIIENRDSLPYGCQTDAVLVNITFDGSVLTYREKGTNAAFNAYNSTDSLDLTKPLEFYLTSNDSQTGRYYTLKVNVHQQEGDSLYWSKCQDASVPFGGSTSMKAFLWGSELLVLEAKASGIMLARRSGLEPSGTWTETATTGLPATADVQSLRWYLNTLYLSTADGSIYTSEDGSTWQQKGTTMAEGLTLAAVSSQYFYAISNGKILRSQDATTWEEDLTDQADALIPQSDVRSLTLQQANGNTRIVLLGQRDDTDHAVVWNKMWNESEPEQDAPWTFFPLSADNTIPCPRLKDLCLLPYDNMCIAFGGPSADNQHEALDAMYISQDYGITWRPSTEFRLPADLKGTEGSITGLIDENHFIWIITEQQVWRGRLNRLGFAQQD